MLNHLKLKGDITQPERNTRLSGQTLTQRVGASIDEAIRNDETREQIRRDTKKGIMVLLIVAGGILAIDQVAQKIGQNLPTVQDVDNWAQENLHGQVFKK